MTKTETKPFCTISVPQEISEDQVRGLLCSALEGGSNYWYCNTDHRLRDDLKYEDFQAGGSQTLDEYWHPYELIPFVEGCALVIEADTTDCEKLEKYTLDRASMQRGLKLMAEQYPHHFYNFINEDDDAETGDVFLQLSLFQKVIFG